MSLVRIPVNCSAEVDEVVKKYSVALWVWCAGTTRQSLTRLLGSCSSVNHRVLRQNVSTCQTLCTLASRCGRCRPIDGEAEVRVTFFSAVAARSSQNSTKVSNFGGGFTSSSHRFVLFIVRALYILVARRLNFDLCCVPSGFPRFLQPGDCENARQPLCCRSFCAPNMSPVQADADATMLHARLGVLLLRLQVHLF